MRPSTSPWAAAACGRVSIEGDDAYRGDAIIAAVSGDRSAVEGDDRLMARYAAGDAGAFRVLYEKYEEPLYGFCLRLLGDPAAADDAFQDTFLRVIEARETYRARGRFRSWVFTIARRVCIDRLRAPSHASLEAAGGGADRRDPAAAVLAGDEVARALAALTPGQREVVLLSRYYGFAYREIAEITGTTEAGVKMKAHRALNTLRAWRTAANS